MPDPHDRAVQDHPSANSDMPPPDAHVVHALEACELPQADAPLAAWYAPMPDAWLRAIARAHGVDEHAADLPAALAERLSDAEHLADALADRLPDSLHGMLGALLALGSGAIYEDDDTWSVDADWSQHPPATPGGQLRALGLAVVGSIDGEPMAMVPTPLEDPLEQAFLAADPDAYLPEKRALDRDLALAGVLDDDDLDLDLFDDDDDDDFEVDLLDDDDGPPPGVWPEGLDEPLRHWVAVDTQVAANFSPFIDERYERIHESSRELSDALPGLPRDVSAILLIYEHMLYSPREDGPSWAAQLFGEIDWEDDEHRDVARAHIDAVPGLFRVRATFGEFEIRLEPLFPQGEPIIGLHPTLARTVEAGTLLALRPYAAGPFTFVRDVSGPLDNLEGQRILRALKAEHERCAPSLSATDFVRTHPLAFLGVLGKFPEPLA